MNSLHLILALACTLAASGQCFALREIAVLTSKEAKALGIQLKARPAGADALWLELEFKPEGTLKEFTHVELRMAEGKKAPVIAASLRDTRTRSGSVLVTFTVSRVHFENVTLSVVMHSPGEAGDHTYELRLKEMVSLEKIR